MEAAEKTFISSTNWTERIGQWLLCDRKKTSTSQRAEHLNKIGQMFRRDGKSYQKICIKGSYFRHLSVEPFYV